MTPRELRAPVLALALLVGVPACGPKAPEGPVLTPLTAQDRIAFDDGVDYVEDPEALEGRWREEWSDELEGRVGAADAVALLTITTVRTDQDPSRRVTYRLVGAVSSWLLEELEDEVVLQVTEGARGWGTVHNAEGRLLDRSFVAFLRLYREEGQEELRSHFHLSPATDPVVARVRFLLERRRGVQRARPTRTVVVHEE